MQISIGKTQKSKKKRFIQNRKN